MELRVAGHQRFKGGMLAGAFLFMVTMKQSRQSRFPVNPSYPVLVREIELIDEYQPF